MAIKVIKKDGTRVPYERDKVKRGIEKACWKRPVADDAIETILNEIENQIYTNFESEVQSRLLGECIMDRLRAVDQVAYVRFASVYREFQDVRDFVDELQPMLKDSRAK